MSSHRRRVKHFHRASGPRKALLKGLVESLVENGRIKTTVDKAKELRRHVEKAVTLGKKDNLATRRLLLSRFPSEKVVKIIMTDLSPRFKTRPGGYTRIIKIGRRPGDNAEMAFIEFVDYKYTDKPAKKEQATDSTDTNGEESNNETKAKKVKTVTAKKSSSKVKVKTDSTKKAAPVKKGAKAKAEKSASTNA